MNDDANRTAGFDYSTASFTVATFSQRAFCFCRASSLHVYPVNPRRMVGLLLIALGANALMRPVSERRHLPES